jgi:hypothetical protein
VRTRIALVALIVTSNIAKAERVWDFPALTYGPECWSILRLSNDSAVAQTFQVRVHDEKGMELQVPAEIPLLPGGVRELRIESPERVFHNAWARVTASSEDTLIDPVNVRAEAFTEFLTGNVLNRYERKPESANANMYWSTTATAAASHEFYFVNTGLQPTVLSVCSSSLKMLRDCSKPSGGVARLLVQPNHSVRFKMGQPKGPFVTMISSVPGSSIFIQLTDGALQQKRFETESSIVFDQPLQ